MTGAELLERVMADWRDLSVRGGLVGTSRFVKLLPSVRLRATDAAEDFLLGRTAPAPWDVDEEHMPEGLGRLLAAYEEALVGDETPDTARAIEEGRCRSSPSGRPTTSTNWRTLGFRRRA
jgi:hypothetical protein